MTGPTSVAVAIFVVLAHAARHAAAAIVEVHLKDQSFNPRAISAKPGDMLVFRNDDRELPVLLPANEALLPAHFIELHTSYEVVIPAAADGGTYELVCTIHPKMKGTLQIIAK
jgi:plastocyanin